MLKNFLLLILLMGGIVTPSGAAPLDLDATFGTAGKMIWRPNNDSLSISGTQIALQTDGKIVMVGLMSPSGPNGFVVARFNSDGTIDPTFNGGFFSIPFGATSASGVSVDIQPDGKIVVGGHTSSVNVRDFAIARLNSNGLLDTTFSDDGKTTVDFPNPVGGGALPSYLNVIKIAPDGKIVIAGSSQGFGTASFHRIIARLNSDGSLDSTFSGDGKFVDGNGTGAFQDVVPHADGTLTLISTASFQFSWRTVVSKFSNTGSEIWGSVNSGTPGCYGSLLGLAEQNDGKPVIVGANDCKPFAFRLNADGSFDNTFSNAPINVASGRAHDLAIQSDGKILANLSFGADGTDAFSLARYNTNGTLDSSWGNAGIATNRVSTGLIERGGSVIIQPDGKILVAGYVRLSSDNYRFAMVRYQGSAAVPVRPLFDYDGDGKSDISVFRPSENKWYVLRSSDFGVIQQTFAIAGDIPVPADYDGDDRTDLAIFRPSSGMWWSLSSQNGAQHAARWGQAGDIPRPSDFDGDGRDDYVLFRPSDNFWYRVSSANGAESNVNFGSAGDKPVLGDFDGDGKSDPAIFRPSSGDWWYRSSINGAQLASHWGVSEDVPAAADFDGDGRTDLAVFRPSTGTWYIYNGSNGSYTIVSFGISEDKPVAADYDGDGKADIAVFRPSTGLWYLLQSTSGFAVTNWGVSTDIPTENAFVP